MDAFYPLLVNSLSSKAELKNQEFATRNLCGQLPVSTFPLGRKARQPNNRSHIFVISCASRPFCMRLVGSFSILSKLENELFPVDFEMGVDLAVQDLLVIPRNFQNAIQIFVEARNPQRHGILPCRFYVSSCLHRYLYKKYLHLLSIPSPATHEPSTPLFPNTTRNSKLQLSLSIPSTAVIDLIV